MLWGLLIQNLMCKYLLEKKQIIYRKYFKAAVFSETQFAFMISIAKTTRLATMYAVYI